MRVEESAKSKHAFIDKTGKIAIPARFDQAYSFSEGLAAVETGFRAEGGIKVSGRWGFIDKSGTVLRNYSLTCCDVEWKQEPKLGTLPTDGTHAWIEQPPQGVFISSGTKTNIHNRKYLEDGDLVDPYPANSYDMQRNRAIEVVFVKIKDGPHRNAEGWMPIHLLRPTVVMP